MATEANKAAAERSASNTFPADAETHVLVVTRRAKHAPVLYRLDLTKDLAERFRDFARGWATNELLPRTLVQYSAGRSPSSSEAVWLPRNDAPLLAEIENGLLHPANPALLDPNATHLRDARLFVIRIALDDDKYLAFFGPLGPKARLERKTRVVAIFSEGTFDAIKQEVLIFDNSLYAVLGQNYFFVTQQGTFEAAFGLITAMRPIASGVLDHLATSLRISNFPSFRDVALNDLNMVRKLRSVAAKLENEKYKKAMNMPSLLKFLDDRPEIAVDLQGTGEHREFVFHNDPQRRWRLLKLLDDDYLHSALTELDYESNSKDLLTP